MFLEFYGLSEQPFGVTPNPRFFYSSLSHREALASLICGIENRLGFATLIAEPGMGKTTLLFSLLQRYRNSASVAWLFNTQCDSRDFMRHLIGELDAGIKDEDLLSMREAFETSLRFRNLLIRESEAGRGVLVVVDEAQNLEDSVLETVRLLSNFETSENKLLHIVLAGQPQLEEKLSRPSLVQLAQRVAISSRLRRLAPDEVGHYVDHRLRVAGRAGNSPFSAEAMRGIVELSGGVPRNINRLCFQALSLGCALGKKVIDGAVLEEVAEDLGLKAPGPVMVSRRPNLHSAPPAPAPVFGPEATAPSLDKLPHTPPLPRERPSPSAAKLQEMPAVKMKMKAPAPQERQETKETKETKDTKGTTEAARATEETERPRNVARPPAEPPPRVRGIHRAEPWLRACLVVLAMIALFSLALRSCDARWPSPWKMGGQISRPADAVAVNAMSAGVAAASPLITKSDELPAEKPQVAPVPETPRHQRDTVRGTEKEGRATTHRQARKAATGAAEKDTKNKKSFSASELHAANQHSHTATRVINDEDFQAKGKSSNNGAQTPAPGRGRFFLFPGLFPCREDRQSRRPTGFTAWLVSRGTQVFGHRPAYAGKEGIASLPG